MDYPDAGRAVGRFEADFFDPLRWRPEYPNPAFDLMRPDDAFWAARLVARFSDAAIRAVVAKAGYSEPGAAEYIASTLIKRRDKVLRAWLTQVNPVVEPRLSTEGTLTWMNAAIEGGVTSAPASYVLTWSRFDNATGTSAGPTEETRVSSPRADAPSIYPAGGRFHYSLNSNRPSRLSRLECASQRLFETCTAGWEAVELDREPAATL